MGVPPLLLADDRGWRNSVEMSEGTLRKKARRMLFLRALVRNPCEQFSRLALAQGTDDVERLCTDWQVLPQSRHGAVWDDLLLLQLIRGIACISQLAEYVLVNNHTHPSSRWIVNEKFPLVNPLKG